MIKVDFHVHSTYSDGLLAPKNIVERAYRNSVKYLALTDHDTISGLDEAKEKAQSLGINFIPGIELSTDYKGESIHILGFFKDNSYQNKDFIKFLHSIKERRKIRAIKMVDKLKEEFNILIDKDKVLKRGKDVVARPHIAYEIISSGYNYTKDEIFNRFIGKDCAAYVPTNKLSPKEGIEILKQYNALTFLAHPILINNSPLTDFLSFGFDGIEAIYFQNSEKDEEKLIKFAKENNLLISAGSDCHGDFIDDTRHGDIGSMNFKESYLTSFLNKYYK